MVTAFTLVTMGDTGSSALFQVLLLMFWVIKHIFLLATLLYLLFLRTICSKIFKEVILMALTLLLI